MANTYDYSEITAPIAYRQAKKEAPKVNSRWLVIVLVLSIFMVTVLVLFIKSWQNASANMAYLGTAGLMLAGIVACYAVYRMQIIKAARLQRFAKKNNLELLVDQQPAKRDSVLFGQGDQRSVLFGFRDHATALEIGQYRYITGAYYGARIWQYTYAALQSATTLPSVYIHSRKNDAPARSTTDITRSVKDLPGVDYGPDFSEKFVVHNMGTATAAKLPAAVKAWLLQHGDDFDYMLWGTNVLLFRRGYIRFTKLPDLQQFFNFVKCFNDVLQNRGVTSTEPVVAPQPAFNAGQTRRLVYGAGFVVVSATVLYSIGRAIAAFI